MRAKLRQWNDEGTLLWVQLVLLAVAHVPAASGLELRFIKLTGLWLLRQSPGVSAALAAFTGAMLAALWFIPSERRVPRLTLAGVLFAAGIVGALVFAPALIMTYAWTARTIARPHLGPRPPPEPLPPG
jgi:hypothetical protein